MKQKTMIHTVGKTPLLRAESLEKKLGISKIYLKLEGNNPSGQRIDRLSYLLIKDAISVNKRTICIGSHLPLCRSLALLSQYYDINCVFIFPSNNKAFKDKSFNKNNIKLIEYGENPSDCIGHSKELSLRNGWYNGTLGIDNNVLNMTALSYIAKELHTQVRGEIDTVFSLMDYGFSISGLNLGFRQLWINNEIKRIPNLYNCTVQQENVIYNSYLMNSKKVPSFSNEGMKVSKHTRHLLNLNRSMAQDILDSIYDADATITGVDENDLIKYIDRFLKVENIMFGLENGYAIAGFMQEVEEGNLRDGNHVILLNDGRIDLDVRNVEENEIDLSIDELADFIHDWLMEFTDPLHEVKEALKVAFKSGFVLLAYYNGKLAGISVIVPTGFENFLPKYHLGYIATKRTIKGRGIATQLLNKAVELTNGNISLHVDRDNNRAIKLYEKMGFAKSYLRMIHKSR